MSKQSPYHRSDGSLTAKGQVVECVQRNTRDVHAMFETSGNNRGRLKSNLADLREMFSL